jgi:hypothetical protein
MNVETMNDPIDNKPWYTHGWLWLVIALPFSAVVAGISTFFIAAHDPDSLVVDEYYKKGLAINEVLDREQNASALGLKAHLEFNEDKIRLSLEGTQPKQVVVKFIHPTRSQYDQTVVLEHDEQGYYYAKDLKGLTSVAWYVHVEDIDESWRLQGRYNPASGQALDLQADTIVNP